MSEPVTMVCDDGSEWPMTRCAGCGCPKVEGYRCPGCEAKGYREAAREIRAAMSALSATLTKWER